MTQTATFGRRGVAAPPPRPGQPKAAARPAAQGARAAAPQTAPRPATTARGESALNPLLRLFFSYKGRIRRRDYWLGHISVTVAMFVGLWFETSMRGLASGNLLALLLLLVFSVALPIAGIWSALAVQVKRWHDRDKGWPWAFIVFIPFVGGLWAFVELGCLDGTRGDNRFGHSPKLGPAEVFS